jgi:hypothetical protein
MKRIPRIILILKASFQQAQKPIHRDREADCPWDRLIAHYDSTCIQPVRAILTVPAGIFKFEMKVERTVLRFTQADRPHDT